MYAYGRTDVIDLRSDPFLRTFSCPLIRDTLSAARFNFPPETLALITLAKVINTGQIEIVFEWPAFDICENKWLLKVLALIKTSNLMTVVH